MRSRHGGLHRMAKLMGVFLLACTLLAVGPYGRAYDAVCGNGDTSACCVPPRLETFGGWSLFWHEPGCTPTGGLACERYSHLAEAPRFYSAVDCLALTRHQSGWLPFQAQASVEETVATEGEDPVITYTRQAVLSTSSFDDEFQPGVRALIGVSLSDWYRLEFSYFGSYWWDDTAAVRYNAADGSGNLLSPFSHFGDSQGRPGLDPLPDDGSFQPVVGLDFNDAASIRYSSRLDSAELNVRRRICMPHDRHLWGEVSCLVGLRYMGVDEEFGYRTVSGILDPSEDVRTDNDLFGVQIGALAQFLVHHRAWIDLQVKGGLLFNQAKSYVTATVPIEDGGEPEETVPITDQVECSSFVGDISLQFNYQFAPSWTIRAGYNAIWLTGLALASENFVSDVGTLANGPGSVEHGGQVVYHGPNIGLIWAH